MYGCLSIYRDGKGQTSLHEHTTLPTTNSSHNFFTPQSASIAPKPLLDKPAPPLGTYVIKIPKDIVHRVPPPENARRYEQYTHKKHRRDQHICLY